MKNGILLIASLWWGFALQAQFEGGNGDGNDQAPILQQTLQGQTWGTAGMFSGGNGDGQDLFRLVGWLNGTLGDAMYGGGMGDGQDQILIQALMNGADLSQLYLGGDGDGNDHFRIQAFFDNTSSFIIYNGGNGDGQDRESVQVYVNGIPTATYFAGGDGDGQDWASVQSLMSGDALSALYRGGDGDGHDMSQYSGVVPFPIVLLSFDAFPEEEFVLVQWVTEREENSAYFTVEKTRDGNLFLEVDQVQAAGFSEELLPYETIDPYPFEGQSFYRLKSTDLDGAFQYSQLVEVIYYNSVMWDFSLYPNPNRGQSLNIDLRGLSENDHFVIQLADMQGKMRYEVEVHATYAGGLTHPIELNQALAKGSYVVRVMSEDKGQMAKLLLVR